MAIGILFESREWSSTALADYIRLEGIEAELFDLELDVDMNKILESEVIVNRVFASAQFRDHHRSLEKVKEVLDAAVSRGIPLINSREAHYIETSKLRASKLMIENDLPTPVIYAYFNSAEGLPGDDCHFPAVLKPDCGGRTKETFILNSREELDQALAGIERPIDFILQKYIKPVKGFLTRIEVIGGECYSIMKRTLADGGLSAYALGSQYLDYPECSEEIRKAAVKVMRFAGIDMGSLDIIEGEDGFFIIDINSVSNFEPPNIEQFGYNLILDMAKFVAVKYKYLKENNFNDYAGYLRIPGQDRVSVLLDD